MTFNAFSAVVGQAPAVALLSQAIAQNRMAPAYLFAGPAGVGRSLTARCFIEQLFAVTFTDPPAIATLQNRLRQGNHPDVLWVQPTYLHQGKLYSATEAAEAGLKRKAPPQIRLEQIREISQFLSRPALEASRSIIVIEDAQTMAEAAANGLLKTLEEPGNATLILIAPGADALLPTLVSRCQRIPFYQLSETNLKEILQRVGYAEILQHPTAIAIASGSPGEAIAAWQQLQSMPPDLLQKVTQPLTTLKAALELAKEIDKQLDTEAQLWLIDYWQHCYWQSTCQGQTYHSFILEKLEKARQYLRSYAQPRLVWEVTLMEIIQSN